MASLIIVKNADFSSVALDKVDIGSVAWLENHFTWGKGGINTKGTSSGATNRGMSMISPLPYASRKTILKAANGYVLKAVLRDTTPTSPNTGNYSFVQYPDGDLPETLEIPAGYYYQVNIVRLDGENADITEGHNSLLIQEITF